MRSPDNFCRAACPLETTLLARGQQSQMGDLTRPMAPQESLQAALGSLAGGGLGEAVLLATESLRHIHYASDQCASREKSPTEWQPSPHCREKALEQAAQIAPCAGNFSETRIAALACVGLGPDLSPLLRS